MESYHYPELHNHKPFHDRFVKKIAQFRKDVAEGRATVSMDLMNFLKEWLVGHIMGEDKKYGAFINAARGNHSSAGVNMKMAA